MNHQTNTRLQVLWNRLLAVVEEQAQALIRAAFSPIVRECGDISAGIFDYNGKMLAQAVTGTPGHINTMAEAVKTLRTRFHLNDLRPGDILMTNDPWIASGHLNDFLLMMPAFYKGNIVGFTACTSHLVDLGGLGMGPEGADIYDEGLLIPPCKLVSQGEINALLMEIIKANSREPIANEGDIYALITCCEAGVERLTAMMMEFELSDLNQLSEYIISTSLEGTKAAIREIPNGEYAATLKIEGYENEIDLCANLIIYEEEILLDFNGTSPCSVKGINVPLNYATAYSVFALRCIIGPEIPNNAGSLQPFKVTAPPNCILNALPPAPVAMRHTIGQMTPDLVYGCLSQALPDRVPAEGASCMYDLPLRNLPDAERNGGKIFALELVFNGGTGARPTKDGLSTTAFPSGVWGSQIETTESVAPLLFKRRELRAESGGKGKYCGGHGQTIELTPTGNNDLLLFLSLERTRFGAKGRNGGLAGKPGSVRVSPHLNPLPGKGEVVIPAGETLTFETPGGGGFGNPGERSRELLNNDIEEGLISGGDGHSKTNSKLAVTND